MANVSFFGGICSARSFYELGTIAATRLYKIAHFARIGTFVAASFSRKARIIVPPAVKRALPRVDRGPVSNLVQTPPSHETIIAFSEWKIIMPRKNPRRI